MLRFAYQRGRFLPIASRQNTISRVHYATVQVPAPPAELPERASQAEAIKEVARMEAIRIAVLGVARTNAVMADLDNGMSISVWPDSNLFLAISYMCKLR